MDCAIGLCGDGFVMLLSDMSATRSVIACELFLLLLIVLVMMMRIVIIILIDAWYYLFVGSAGVERFMDDFFLDFFHYFLF
jgi:hypothetical protein